MGRNGLVAGALALLGASVMAVTGAPVPASAASASASTLAGCAYTEMCVVDRDQVVYHAFGDSGAWPSNADDRADRIVNNGSAFDLIVYEHGAGAGARERGWALCIPRGQIVGLAGLRPAVHDQASSHRWVGAGTCNGEVSWLRAPGAPRGSGTSSSGGAHVARAVEVARSQLGVREVPTNRGARVTAYQRSVRNDKVAVGQPWCASFLTWVFAQAGDPTLVRSAAVGDWVRAAANGRSGLSLVSSRDVRVGDLVAFKKAGGWQHMGIVSSTYDGISVISGNTTAPDRKADGVFEKPLSNWTTLGYTAAFLRNDH